MGILCSPGPIQNDSDLLSFELLHHNLIRPALVFIMMASIAQPFAGHQAGLAGHAGVAHGGLPMSQGHPSNQGVPGVGQQPGVSMGQQMHAGIAGPGGAQVTQAGPMMAGMIPSGGPAGVPGAGPSAMALQHLNPGGHQGQVIAAQQQQQQQQQMQQASK